VLKPQAQKNPFVQSLVQTHHFMFFIESRVEISEYESHYQFFDWCIEQKHGKKDALVFRREAVSSKLVCRPLNQEGLE